MALRPLYLAHTHRSFTISILSNPTSLFIHYLHQPSHSSLVPQHSPNSLVVRALAGILILARFFASFFGDLGSPALACSLLHDLIWAAYFLLTRSIRLVFVASPFAGRQQAAPMLALKTTRKLKSSLLDPRMQVITLTPGYELLLWARGRYLFGRASELLGSLLSVLLIFVAVLILLGTRMAMPPSPILCSRRSIAGFLLKF